MDFLFIHVPKRTNYYKPIDDFMFINYIPMGVFALANLLNDGGYQTRILHMGVEIIRNKDFSVVEWLADKDVPVIGFSLHWHYQSFDVIDVARKIKERYPEKHIVLGGYTASLFAEEILKNFPFIDSVIRGDAEVPVKELAGAFISKDLKPGDVQNLVWRKGQEIIFNPMTYVGTEEIISEMNYTNLPLLYHYETYVESFSIPLFWLNNATLKENKRFHLPSPLVFPLFVGRGCNVDCSFCGGGKSAQKKIAGRHGVIFRSVPSVIQSMKEALSYGYKTMNICFQPVPGDNSYYLELFRAIRSEGIKSEMNFECWGLPDEEFIKEFALTFPSKLSSIALSPEIGVEGLRKKNKGIHYSNSQLFQSMDLLKKYKVTTDVFFTIGLVDETEETVKETRKVIQQLHARYHSIINKVVVIPVQIEPGSPIFENPDKLGFSTDRKCFMDFYNSHGNQQHSNPYGYLGFYSRNFFSTDTSDSSNSSDFSKMIEEIRCNNFCHVAPSIFRRLDLPIVGKMMCGGSCRRWIRKGFGKPSETRATFQ